MNLKTLAELPPWDWPDEATAILLGALRRSETTDSDRLLAVRIAGDSIDIDDELASTLLSILNDRSESSTLRAQTATALGPALEEADTQGFEDPEDTAIAETVFNAIATTFHRLYLDGSVPQEVRRRVLEAAVRVAGAVAPGCGARCVGQRPPGLAADRRLLHAVRARIRRRDRPRTG
jgi:uncharacterized protein (UPF0147 family)